MSQRLLSFAEAARELTTELGRPIHMATVRRWAVKGIASKHQVGVRFRLATQRVGGRVFVPEQSLRQFLNLCDGRDAQQSSSRRHRNGESAARQLLREKYGFSYAPQNEVHQLQQDGGTEGGLPPVLPIGPLRHSERQDNRATAS